MHHKYFLEVCPNPDVLIFHSTIRLSEGFAGRFSGTPRTKELESLLNNTMGVQDVSGFKGYEVQFDWSGIHDRDSVRDAVWETIKMWATVIGEMNDEDTFELLPTKYPSAELLRC